MERLSRPRLNIRLRFEHPLAKLLQVEGIVLYPYVLFSKAKDRVPKRVILHEMVHVRQVRELGWLRFYGSYFFEYLRHLFRLRNHVQAYLMISYEREAYGSETAVVLTEAESNELRAALV